MIGVLCHDSALKGYTGPGTTWANKIHFVMNHAPGAGTFAQTVDLQSTALILSYGCPLIHVLYMLTTVLYLKQYHCNKYLHVHISGTLVLLKRKLHSRFSENIIHEICEICDMGKMNHRVYHVSKWVRRLPAKSEYLLLFSLAAILGNNPWVFLLWSSEIESIKTKQEVKWCVHDYPLQGYTGPWTTWVI